MGLGVTIDRGRCKGCLRCTQVCIVGHFVPDGEGRAIAADDRTNCFQCGHCLAACPTGAISHTALELPEVDPDRQPQDLEYDELLGFLRMRRSRREFRDMPVAREDIVKLLDAAVQAPSAMNRQNIEFTAVTSPDQLRGISDLTAGFMRSLVEKARSPIGRSMLRLAAGKTYPGLIAMIPKMERIVRTHESGHDAILYRAPCLLMLHAPKSDLTAQVNAVYCAANILLAAETLGLGACVIGFVSTAAGRDPRINRLAQLPDDHALYTAIALGQPRFPYARPAPKRPPKVRFV